MIPVLVAFLLVLVAPPAWAQPLPLPSPGQWGVVSRNALADVLWRDGAGRTINQLKGANADVENAFKAWNGAGFDPAAKCLKVGAVGGDSDGADTGVYPFCLPTGLWSRSHDPDPATIPHFTESGVWPYGDAIQARHTYGGVVDVPGVGLCVVSGVAWHPYNFTARPDIGKAWCATATGWKAFDLLDATRTENWCGWDSIGRRALCQSGSALMAFDPTKPAGSQVSRVDDGSQPSDSRNRFFQGVVDTKRNRMIGAGVRTDGTPTLEGFELGTAPVRRKTFISSAPWGTWTVAPGLLWDPVADRYVVWPNAGRDLWSIHPDTFAVTRIVGAGADPGAPGGNGTFGRFAYVPPPEDVYLLAARVQGPVLAYKPVRDGTIPPVVDPPPGGGLAGLPTRVLVAVEGPQPGQGVNVSHSMKHVTATPGPGGRIYFIGGDYRSKGNPSSQSYVQEGWSLSLPERYGQVSTAAGWREEWPYCAPAGAVQPKHPDFVGWQWDAARGLLWMVPGSMFHLEAGQDVCPGETNVNGSDGTYKVAVMTFNPATRAWAVALDDKGPDWIDSWMSVLDPVRNRLIRFGWSGGSGGRYNMLELSTMTWWGGGLTPNAANQDWRVFKEYMAADLQGRVIYAIDAVAGRLGAFNMDTLVMVDHGPVPGGSFGTENRAHPVWDSTAKRLIFLRGAVHVYDPATRTWEAVPAVTVPAGLSTEYRMAVYSPADNVTLFMGGVETPNPNLLLFRYAAGTTPPPGVPAAPLNLTIR